MELEESYIADKVIGKAAAIIIVLSNVKMVYTKMISKQALELLEEFNIQIEYIDKVEYIENRDKTGLCPLEKLTMNINNLQEGLSEIIKFYNNIKK